MKDEYKRAFQSVVLLLSLSTILGLGSNAIRGQTLPLFRPLPSLLAGEVSLQDAHQLWKADVAVFWDVRSEKAYRKAHLPAALSPKATPPQGKTVIVYCSGRLCPKAHEAAKNLRSQGFHDVRVMPDGITGWKSAGYSLQRSGG